MPVMVVALTFRLKQYSLAAPLETGVLATVPAVFPDVKVGVGVGVGVGGEYD